MTTSEIDSINRTRLDTWRKHLTAGHSTPIILLGVGHDAVSGQWCVCTLEDDCMPDADLVAALRGVATRSSARHQGHP